eukprot:2921772-Rhodomonas_salina.1
MQSVSAPRRDGRARGPRGGWHEGWDVFQGVQTQLQRPQLACAPLTPPSSSLPRAPCPTAQHARTLAVGARTTGKAG